MLLPCVSHDSTTTTTTINDIPNSHKYGFSIMFAMFVLQTLSQNIVLLGVDLVTQAPFCLFHLCLNILLQFSFSPSCYLVCSHVVA